ncbi:MAG: 2,3-bisphosphoglycerate-independent phosphoglycerate mutase [Planctomycetota bacterium]|jgi:2,3-bisphosphoglycerate-independent phosphoglycerate mutase
MKSFILLPTGIADVPVHSLDGLTPLAAANTPHLDRLARRARVGLVRQVPEGMRNASDVAVLSVMGYDPRETDCSRGGIEAAGMGVTLGPDDLALRMNFVSTFRGALVDFNAGHIGSVEARLLVESLQEQLGGETFSFHAGLGYRNLLVVRGGRKLDFETVPPQEVQGHPLADYLPYGPDAGPLLELLEHAAEVLAAHDVNRVRVDLGENPADRIWPWGAGWATELEPFSLRTGRDLAVIAAVPLVRGLGTMMGAEVPAVPGATGHYDTDWTAKTRRALAELDRHDVVVLHLAAANEACHETDVRLKIRVIEEMDRFVVGPLLKALSERGDTRLLVTTDHMTSTVERELSTTHVPFALWGPGIEVSRGAERFTEEEAEAGDMHVEEGHTMLEYVLDGALPHAPAEAAE